MKRLLPVLMGFALLLLSSTEGWSLPSCPTYSHASNWTDCFGTLPLPVGTNTLVNSRMAKGTDKAPLPLPVGPNTLVNGRMTKGTDKAPKPMPMEQFFKKAYLKKVNSSTQRNHHPNHLL